MRTNKTAPRYRNLPLQVQEITGETVEIAFVDQGYTGEQAASDAAQEGIQLEVVKLPPSQEGICFTSSPMGSGAKFCVDWTLWAQSLGL